jgi:hypothetical protein
MNLRRPSRSANGRLGMLFPRAGRRADIAGTCCRKATDPIDVRRLNLSCAGYGLPGAYPLAKLLNFSYLFQLYRYIFSLISYHAPWPGLGHVARAGGAFRYVPEPLIRRPD